MNKKINYLFVIIFFITIFFLQAVDFNIFEGQVCHGVTEVTISRGKVVYERTNGVSLFRCIV